MAADRSQYNDRPIAQISKNSIQIWHWHALIHFDKATHLARFYLDEVEVNVDDNGVQGLCGVCNVGSANYYMHAPSRRGCMASGAAGGNGICFQDGGVNTKGNVQTPTVTSTEVGNIVLAPKNFTAAWYVDSSDYGFGYKPEDGRSNWLNIRKGTYIAQATVATTGHTIAEDIIEAGFEISFRCYHDNAEGPYISPNIITITATPRLKALKYSPQFASYAYNSETIFNKYISRASLDGDDTKMYDNLFMSVNAPTGYYTDDIIWYKIELVDGKSMVTDRGICVPAGWPKDDPAYVATPTYVAYDFYSADSQGLSCERAAVYDSTYNVIIYKAVSDQRWYYNVTLTALVTGYFSNEGAYIHIVDGVEQSSGVC